MLTNIEFDDASHYLGKELLPEDLTIDAAREANGGAISISDTARTFGTIRVDILPQANWTGHLNQSWAGC